MTLFLFVPTYLFIRESGLGASYMMFPTSLGALLVALLVIYRGKYEPNGAVVTVFGASLFGALVSLVFLLFAEDILTNTMIITNALRLALALGIVPMLYGTWNMIRYENKSKLRPFQKNRTTKPRCKVCARFFRCHQGVAILLKDLYYLVAFFGFFASFL